MKSVDRFINGLVNEAVSRNRSLEYVFSEARVPEIVEAEIFMNLQTDNDTKKRLYQKAFSQFARRGTYVINAKYKKHLIEHELFLLLLQAYMQRRNAAVVAELMVEIKKIA